MDRPHFQSALTLSALLILLTACSNRGDFGRTEPSFFEDRVLPVTRSLVGHARGEVISDYPLSEDEKSLRRLSRDLSDPKKRTTAKKTLYRQAHAAGIVENKHEHNRRRRHDIGLEPAKYRSPYKVHYALLAAIKDDIRLTELFTHTSRRIYKTDNIRYRRLVASSDLSGDEIRNVTGRLKDNREIVEATLLVLENRVSDYELDLRHMKLRAPAPLERDIALAIDTLAQRAKKLHSKASSWARARVAAKHPQSRTY